MLENFFEKLRIPERFFSDESVRERYVDAGSKVGCALVFKSINGLGMDFMDNLKDLKKWEKEYAYRGYRVVNLERFRDKASSGCEERVNEILRQRRSEDEGLVCYAADAYEKYRKMKKTRVRKGQSDLPDIFRSW